MKYPVMLAALLSVTGCQMMSASEPGCVDCGVVTAAQADEQHLQQLAGGHYVSTEYAARIMKPLSDYAADLALQLAMSAQALPQQQLIAISSFVQFDSSLNNSDALGNQLAEHLYFQLQRLGMSVADIKLASQIKVSSRGDFVFSRGQRLDSEAQINFVVAGTMLRDAGGTVVNARLVNLVTKAVVATAQIHIPDAVLVANLAQAER